MTVWIKILFCVSFLWIFNGLLIKKIRRWHATEVQFALLAGIIAGPFSGWILESSINEVNKLMEWACKFTMSLALSAAALHISRNFIRKHIRLLTLVVLAGMLLMAASTALLLKFGLSLSWSVAILLGWILTPTDPVVTATVVNGENAERLLPLSLRRTILFESGINDGLAAPMVILAYTFWHSRSLDLPHWLAKVVGYENILAGIVALIIGYLAGILFRKAHKAGFMSDETIFTYSLALTFTLLTGLELLKMNAIIGVFLGNLGFARTITKHEDLEQGKVSDSLQHLFTIPVFFLLGLFIPWKDWLQMGWPVLLVVILIVLLRRLPAFLLMRPLLGPFKNFPSSSWLGWIGPIGVAAILYALEAEKEAGFTKAWPIVTLVVCVSVLIHGSTSLFASQWYHKASSKEKKEKEEK